MPVFRRYGKRLMKVNIFDLKFDEEYIKKYEAGCREILETSFLAEGKYTKQFEKLFAEFSDAKHAICVTSGTAALEIALKAVQVENKEVIIPSNTFFATANAVRNAGGILKLVDIEENTFSICPEDLKKQITANTKAVVIVHIGGIISRHMKQILDICKERNILLIEDAAHAQGAKIGSHTAGSIGDIGCFSFFPTKVMTTGEGGMITTNSDSLNEICMSLKNFGRKNDDISICVNDFGNNYKVSEFTSLMGVLEMGRVKERIARRQKLTKLYRDELLGCYDVFYDENIYNSSYKAIVKTTKNIDYKSLCKKQEVSLTGEVYKIPVHDQPLWKGKFNSDDFPVTNYFCAHHICPPLYPELSEDQIIHVCNTLKRINDEN